MDDAVSVAPVGVGGRAGGVFLSGDLLYPVPQSCFVVQVRAVRSWGQCPGHAPRSCLHIVAVSVSGSTSGLFSVYTTP